MDDKWFKTRQKIAGVTAEDIGREMGRDRSVVSRIYVGRQKMTADQAKVFARVLDVPLSEVLERAGVLQRHEAEPLAPGFADADAVPWSGKSGETARKNDTAATLGGDRPGVDVWTVKSRAMMLAGYLPGDNILVDMNASERVRAGDVVIAQHYNWKDGSAITVLRRFQPPVLVAANTDPEDQQVLVVDGNNVVIKGKIVASWRKI